MDIQPIEDIVDLIGKRIIIRHLKLSGHLIHFDPPTRTVFLFADSLLVIPRIQNIEPDLYNDDQSIKSKEEIEQILQIDVREFGSEQERYDALIKHLQENQFEFYLKEKSICIAKYCWVDPPYTEIKSASKKLQQEYRDKLSSFF